MSRRSIGFTQQDHSTDGMEAIKRMFTPEFRNRLDAIISVQGARPEHHPARRRQVPDASSRRSCTRRRSTLELDDAARVDGWPKGFDPKMGARPMARVIQEHIKRPLADELLFGSRIPLRPSRFALKDSCAIGLCPWWLASTPRTLGDHLLR
jgi:ATP-dependent Clp protease ATP-binding subunit ClpA